MGCARPAVSSSSPKSMKVSPSLVSTSVNRHSSLMGTLDETLRPMAAITIIAS